MLRRRGFGSYTDYSLLLYYTGPYHWKGRQYDAFMRMKVQRRKKIPVTAFSMFCLTNRSTY